jgi:hypothetical protein
MGKAVDSARVEMVADPSPQGFSLLRLSAFARLGLASIAIAGLWGVVFWALS